MCLKGSASVYQRRTDTEEPLCVGKLGPSDYFGMYQCMLAKDFRRGSNFAKHTFSTVAIIVTISVALSTDNRWRHVIRELAIIQLSNQYCIMWQVGWVMKWILLKLKARPMIM